ncbi:hypothetical protein [Aeromonas phage 65.2]|uniref:Uncharacterized protein n=1 Tax=Aeromonas phage 65.2 TaxID=1932896 RepID=A0A219YC60_9CAUD|nr:hypothetical protein [Aeromonas phage 65.2]
MKCIHLDRPSCRVLRIVSLHSSEVWLLPHQTDSATPLRPCSCTFMAAYPTNAIWEIIPKKTKMKIPVMILLMWRKNQGSLLKLPVLRILRFMFMPLKYNLVVMWCLLSRQNILLTL